MVEVAGKNADALPLIHETVSKVTAIMSSAAIRTTTGLRTLQYPPKAIWEIVVNAIIHQDYSISGDVQVRIFDNRIEVLSPGKLQGYVSVHNILEARYFPELEDCPGPWQGAPIRRTRTSARASIRLFRR
jgi:hypothetical protein